MVCLYFSLSLLKRNSGKLGKNGKIFNGKVHWKCLNEAVLGLLSPKLLGGLLTQPYGITDTSLKVCMWQERLNFNCGKGLVDRLYSFDTTAVYVLGRQRTSSHASHTLIPTLKWFKKKLPWTNSSHVQNICLIWTTFTSKRRYFTPLSPKVTHIELGFTDLSQITSERREGTFHPIINRPTHEISVKTHFKTAIKNEPHTGAE